MKETVISSAPSSEDDDGTDKILKNFDPESKDEIVEAVLSEIVKNPRLAQRFLEALVTKKRTSQ